MAEEKKDLWEKYMDGLSAGPEGNQNETMSDAQKYNPVYWGDFMTLTVEKQVLAEEQQAMQNASQPKKVIEIEQKDLKECLENLSEKSQITFTADHRYVYNKLMNLTDTDAGIDQNEKFLVAKNEQNQVVGIGSANFEDAHYLNFLLSVEKGAGTAIVNAIIDYSRQMGNCEDLFLIANNKDLIPYYAQFGFVYEPDAIDLVRKYSIESNSSTDIKTFQPLEATNQEIANKRGRAMSR